MCKVTPVPNGLICEYETGFACPHECGYVYSEEEGSSLADELYESKGFMIRRKTKCCKRWINLVMGMDKLIAIRIPYKYKNN